MDYKEANNILIELDKKYHLLKHGQFDFKDAADFYEFAKTGKCRYAEAFPFDELPLETQKKLKDELKVFNSKNSGDKDGEELFVADIYLCAAKAPGYEKMANWVEFANWYGYYPDMRKFIKLNYNMLTNMFTFPYSLPKPNVDNFDDLFLRFDGIIEGRFDALQAGKDKQATAGNLNKKLKELTFKRESKLTLDKILTAGGVIGIGGAIGLAAANKLAIDYENANPQPNPALKSGNER